MTRYILLFLVILLSVLSPAVVMYKRNPPDAILPVEEPFQPLRLETGLLTLPVPIQVSNRRNESIQSFECDNVEVRVWQGGHRFRLSGKLAYQKPNHFRFVMSSILGKEVEIGSNEHNFWYWSRRDKRPALYFASYEDFSKTRLKTPFDPMFLRASLGLESYDPTDAKIIEGTQHVVMVYPQYNSLGQPITYTTYFNKEPNCLIDGFIVADATGKTVAACQIKKRNRSEVRPAEIIYHWVEEQKTMQLTFHDAEVNTSINPDVWTMPDYQPQINMAND